MQFILNQIILVTIWILVIGASSKIGDFEVIISSLLLLIFIHLKLMASTSLSVQINSLSYILKSILKIREGLLFVKGNNTENNNTISADKEILDGEIAKQDISTRQLIIEGIIINILKGVTFVIIIGSCLNIILN